MLNTSHGWSFSARTHVHTALLYLRNGLTDCVQIWYLGWGSLSTCFPQSWVGWGYLCTCTRAPPPPPPPSPYLRIRLTNFAEIWCVARDPIVTRPTKVGGGVTAHLHVRFQFHCLGNRSALILKPHQKQTYLFRARSYIATHGVLLVFYYPNIFVSRSLVPRGLTYGQFHDKSPRHVHHDPSDFGLIWHKRLPMPIVTSQWILGFKVTGVIRGGATIFRQWGQDFLFISFTTCSLNFSGGNNIVLHHSLISVRASCPHCPTVAPPMGVMRYGSRDF